MGFGANMLMNKIMRGQAVADRKEQKALDDKARQDFATAMGTQGQGQFNVDPTQVHTLPSEEMAGPVVPQTLPYDPNADMAAGYGTPMAGQWDGGAGGTGMFTGLDEQQSNIMASMRDMYQASPEMAQAFGGTMNQMGMDAFAPSTDDVANPEYFQQYTDIDGNTVIGNYDPQAKAIVNTQDGQPLDMSRWSQVSKEPTTSVNIEKGRTLDEEIQLEAAKAFARTTPDRAKSIQSGHDSSRDISDKFKSINETLEGINTGAFENQLLAGEKILDRLNVPMDREAIAKRESAIAEANQIALMFRSPEGVLGGLTGATSDKDLAFLKSMTPQLATTPEGRKLMEEAMIKITERKKAIANHASDYIAKNGFLDKNYPAERARLFDKKDIFSDDFKKPTERKVIKWSDM